MSRTSATFGKQPGTKSSSRMSGVPTTLKPSTPGVMELRRPITEPYGPKSPSQDLWTKSLRSGAVDPGAFDSTGSTMRRSGSFNNLRKSTGSLAASFGTGTSVKVHKNCDLDKIESEYIKNLQQQVYFLELEANYLREQSKKATDMHPQMTAEAERMLLKLRQMQSEVDGLHMEVKRKDNSLDMASTDKGRLLNTLKGKEDAHQREKRLLLEEVVQGKKEKELLEKDSVRKDHQILQAREEMDKGSTALRGAQTKIQMIQNQVEQKSDQLKLTQAALDEKRNELMKTETHLREIEDKYYSSTVTIQDKVVQDLRDEIRMLRQKLKEAEMNSEQDRYLRTKLSDDSSHLVKENALLNQQVIEMTRQLEREKDLRESKDTRRSADITELVLLKDREKQLTFEMNQTKELLKHEQQRTHRFGEKLSMQEQVSTSQEFNASTTRSKLAELEGLHISTENDNAQLRRDKMLLVDHVADLQKQLEERETELFGLRSQTGVMETKVKDLERLKQMETSIHSQKWDEFSRLAESMKSLSQTMARTGSPINTSRSGQMLDYS